MVEKMSRETKSDEPAPVEDNDFRCPISLEIMVDPVTAADGYSYERSQIKTWFDTGNKTSPKTNLVLEHTFVNPNQILKQQIREYTEKIEQQRLQKAKRPY